MDNRTTSLNSRPLTWWLGDPSLEKEADMPLMYCLG